MVICLAVYLPGLFAIPAVDRDEARFAQASRQMARAESSSDYLVPRVQDRPRLNKPPLIYWLQAASAKAFTGFGSWSDAIWMYRVPSQIGAILAVLALWRLGLRMFDPRAAFLGALLLAVCPLLAWESKQARSDVVLLAATTVSMLVLYRLWRERRPAWWLAPAFWVAVAAGVLTKGPITLMVVGLAGVFVAILARDWSLLKRSRPLLGAVFVLGSLGAWVYMVGSAVGFDTYFSTVYDEVIGRSLSPKEGHRGFPGYHLLLFNVLFWPGCLATALGVARAFRLGLRSERSGSGGRIARFWRARRAGRRPELFLLAWVLPSWVVFELVSTKLPHYTLPLYPALALLSARAVLAASAGSLPGAATRLSRLGYGAWVAIGAALGLSPLIIWWGVGGLRDAALLAAAAFVLVLVAVEMVMAWRGIFRGIRRGGKKPNLMRAQLAGVVAAAVVTISLCNVVLPRLGNLWVSKRLAEIIDRSDPARARPIADVAFTRPEERAVFSSYHEDSLIFETGGRSRRLDAIDLDAWLSRHPDGLMVMPVQGAAGRTDLRKLGEVSGYKYSTGKRVRLAVYELAMVKDSP